MLSKPMAALLIEEKPVEAELIFKTKIAGTPLPTLSLANLKKYEGPFDGDQLDLNGGRRWDPVEPLEIELRLPASGLEPPRALLQLVDEVRGSAK